MTMTRRQARATAERLSACRQLARCTLDDLRALARAGTLFTLPAGWPLLGEGQDAVECLVLIDGSASVVRRGVEIATVGPGDIIGEAALTAGGGRRAASVTTATPVVGIAVHADTLRGLMSARPAIKAVMDDAYSRHHVTVSP